MKQLLLILVFISCSNKNTKVITLSNQSSTYVDSLITQQKSVFKLTLDVTSNVSPNTFEVELAEKGHFDKLVLNNFQGDTIFKNDWYSNKCYIKILPTQDMINDGIKVRVTLN